MFGRKKKADKNSVAVRLDGRLLQCAFRRYTDENGVLQEDGLGKNGRINTANGHVIISCGEKEVFHNDDISAVKCGELMSKKGAIFTGYNTLTGQEDTIIAYYSSLYRQ